MSFTNSSSRLTPFQSAILGVASIVFRSDETNPAAETPTALTLWTAIADIDACAAPAGAAGVGRERAPASPDISSHPRADGGSCCHPRSRLTPAHQHAGTVPARPMSACSDGCLQEGASNKMKNEKLAGGTKSVGGRRDTGWRWRPSGRPPPLRNEISGVAGAALGGARHLQRRREARASSLEAAGSIILLLLRRRRPTAASACPAARSPGTRPPTWTPGTQARAGAPSRAQCPARA